MRPWGTYRCYCYRAWYCCESAAQGSYKGGQRQWPPFEEIKELKEEAEKICGIPEAQVFEEDIIAVIKWVDGTVIDSVRKVKN